MAINNQLRIIVKLSLSSIISLMANKAKNFNKMQAITIVHQLKLLHRE